MSSELVIYEILPEGKECEIGRLTGGEQSIGRDSADDIVINNNAVSRSHGMFFKIRNHWFYKDLGSTNGSWINGKLVKEGHIRLVRPGDVLQLADTPLRVEAVNQQAGAGVPFETFGQFQHSTLIVFSGQEFTDEFPLPEYGRALVVGGLQGDLPLSESIEELPRLVVERRGDKICAFGVADGPPIYLNGEEITTTVTLVDGDELRVANYTILFNDPKGIGGAEERQTPLEQGSSQRPAQAMQSVSETRPSDHFSNPQAETQEDMTTSRAFKSWEDPGANTDEEYEINRKTPSGRFTFGQTNYEDEDDVEGTVAINPVDVEARLAGYNLHPSARYQAPLRSSGSSISSLEDKLIVLIGFLLLMCLIGLVVWWVFVS